MKKQSSYLHLLLVGLALLVVALRVWPPDHNLAPLTGLAFMAGYLTRKPLWAFGLPLFAALFSDVLLAHGNWQTALYPEIAYVYAGQLLAAALGLALPNIRKHQNIIAYSLSGSAVFFLVSNFGVWMQHYYAHTLHGLLTCLAAGLPFVKTSIVADLALCISVYAVVQLVPAFKAKPLVA